MRSWSRTYQDLHGPALVIPEEVTAAHLVGTAGTHQDPGVLPAVLRGLLSGSQKPGARRYPVF